MKKIVVKIFKINTDSFHLFLWYKFKNTCNKVKNYYFTKNGLIINDDEMLLKDDYDIIISSSYIIIKLSPFKSSPRKFILIKIEQVSCNIIIEFYPQLTLHIELLINHFH